MKESIILIAVNHPYYGLLAANLAMSIKAVDRDREVIVFYDQGSVPSISHPSHGRYFDRKIMIPKEMYVDGKSKHYGLLKLKLPELALLAGIRSGLYIDVDSLVVQDKNLNKFFDFISVNGFGMEFRGSINVHTAKGTDKIGGWASVDSARTGLTFVNPEIPSFTQSSWIGFDLDFPCVNDVFIEAQNVFNHYIQAKVRFSWYDTVPDELCFSLGAAITGFPMHRDLNYCYFDTGPHIPDRKNIINNYDLFTLPSAGGYRASYAEFYNQLVGMIASKSKGSVHTHFKDKRNLFTPMAFRQNRK